MRGAAVGAMVLAGVGAASPATAFEIFGWRPFGGEEPAEEVSPDAQPYAIAIDVRGVDDDLAGTIRGASLLWQEREQRPPPSTAALLSRVRAEYARVVAGLYAEGFYGGSVEITVDGRDPATILPDADLPSPVQVAMTIETGPRFAFGRVELSGRAPATGYPPDQVRPSPEGLGLVPGGTARSGIVLQSERVLIDEWREQGYPKAAIGQREAVAEHPSRTLDVAVAVDSGPAAVYGPIEVTGTEHMDPEFVAWQSGLQPGAQFDPDDLDRARRQLQRLQVFNATRIVEGDMVAPDGSLPMTLNVVERPRRVIGGGVSYSTIDGAGVEGYWEHRNLFGRAERLRLEARVAGIDGVDPEDFTYSAGATFTKPGVITPLTDLVAALEARREVLDSYTEDTITARVGLAHEFFEGLTGTAGVQFSYASTDDALGTRDLLMASLPLGLVYDGRDNELAPRSGWRGEVKLEPFHEIEFGNTGLIAEASAATYLALGDSLVIAGRVGAGSIVGAPADELPASRLFLLGGSTSIRGYGYRNVGPRDANGDVFGGLSYVQGTLEVRAKVTESISVVPFVDIGSAFDSSFPDFSEDMKIGAGIGVRYATGIGAIRADIAMPLDPGPDDPSFAIYIGLGETF
ncbi:autotransporter assembly complex protein TamA [Methylobrevis albus]|uniref:Outer membrane protein assembly factor n=1 Tax=Methylobrevis albus TaxID=2793297 RepID=A0A931MZK2_9HYPH|nr:autotransporter assembly complex family protein [Methylobrevis albus]MBH0237836.1 outer membrane protein assembly factor [Methylobrevis albus]